jgi:hypothetical protein
MTSELPVHKIYIDTRFKTANSKSDSNFYIDLPETYNFPDGTVAYVDEICIPVSWYTIQKGRNDQLYVAADGVCDFSNPIIIPEGKYGIVSLNNAIVDEINARYPNSCIAEPLADVNRIKIVFTGSTVFEFYRDYVLWAFGVKNLHTINALLGNTKDAAFYKDRDYVSSYIDLFPIRNLYLSSPNLGNFKYVTCTGDCTIIKKIPVTAGYNQIIFNRCNLESDAIEVSKQSIRQLQFKLQDAFGNEVELNGNHWSFTIGFKKRY